MLGAIAGDIIGSRFEHNNWRSKDFQLFHPACACTDDTVHTVALAESLLTGRPYGGLLKEYFRTYPHAGYGSRFRAWAGSADEAPYHSFGNGAAMRVSPVGWFYHDLSAVLDGARQSAEVTHNHPEGIKGAQAVATAIFLARQQTDKASIRHFIEEAFGYDLGRQLDDIRPGYRFDVSCQGSVPEAIIAFLEATDFEDAIRNAVSLGGDSDTIACIAGGIAEAFYGGVPEAIEGQLWNYLDDRLARVARQFRCNFVKALSVE
jgi:ADP-ribosylglycohydrolase